MNWSVQWIGRQADVASEEDLRRNHDIAHDQQAACVERATRLKMRPVVVQIPDVASDNENFHMCWAHAAPRRPSSHAIQSWFILPHLISSL